MAWWQQLRVQAATSFLHIQLLLACEVGLSYVGVLQDFQGTVFLTVCRLHVQAPECLHVLSVCLATYCCSRLRACSSCCSQAALPTPPSLLPPHLP
jgi:hypothetical protein